MSTMGIVKLKQTSTWVLIIKFQKTVGKEKTVTTHLCNCIDQNIYLKYGTCIYCGSPSFSAFLKSNPLQSIVSKNGRKNLELLDLADKVFHLLHSQMFMNLQQCVHFKDQLYLKFFMCLYLNICVWIKHLVCCFFVDPRFSR